MTKEEMIKTLQSRLKKNRFTHSIGVANTAVTLAKRFNVDVDKAFIAGLLHDCAREFEDDQMIDEAIKRGIEIGEVEKQLPLLLHSYIGAKMIKEIYNVDDEEISQAIYRHTVGGRNMTKLDKIIYFADMIEPNRNYPGVDKLRQLAETASLDEMILEGMNQSIIFIISKKSLIHPNTVIARNEMLIKNVECKMQNEIDNK
ncbi:MAG: bis(5'-nucleosyl)-tetraphosphatase (symmetrical) YqeK [Selenomonadaceae bacterium]|nr:bis(5'-nucleosyl)-tetraphosphatase (symmetrical) YqeK [Selenomonadaceae bacterium]